MGEGRVSERWDHTSALLAMLINVHNASDKALASPSDFHPYISGESKKRVESFGELRHLFPEDRENEKK